MVKKEVFEWIRTGQKTIELRRWKAKQGNNAVFQCGRIIQKKAYAYYCSILFHHS